ncbi:MAG: GNAT family N-acetyltransferase [Desulfitobacteriaceae bacterium]
MYSEIINSLIKDPIRNAAVLGFFKNYPIERAFRVGDTFLLLGESDHLWGYISSKSKSELTEIFEKSWINTKFFASVEDWMKPIITKDSEVEWELSTLRYVLPETHEIEPPIRKMYTLDMSLVDYIFNHSDYKAFTSKEYIRERIEKGISAGIMEGDTLVAWALTHDDNSLGFLHVLPDFRRKGYGKDITTSLIYQKRKENKSVFLNVEPNNLNSMNLITKIGFILDRKISWIKLK